MIRRAGWACAQRRGEEARMQHQLKSISKAGIPEALAKVEVYRYLNEPEEAESICRDILAADPEHQLARRMLGLAITDQFSGAATDRYGEVQTLFQGLRDAYESNYYLGLLQERRAKAQLQAGRAPHTLLPLIEEAMRCFAEAEKIRPAGNDDSILRWNRCARLLESRPEFHAEHPGPHAFDAQDTPPEHVSARRSTANR
jgi:tetratricopeptide (TPR) repeat protein